MNLIFSLPWIQLFWIFTLHDCRAQVTTQPSDVAVPTGGEAVFTCVVQIGSENIHDDDVSWNNMGNNITVMSTSPYMVKYKVTDRQAQLTSTLTITNVRMEHAGLYKFVLVNTRDGDVISETAVLTVLTATITTQPSDFTVCTGAVSMFTCVVDRNGTNITSDDVMWQQIRPEGSTSTLSTSLGGLPFIIMTTISGDIINSTLTVKGVADGNVLGSSLYRCVVPVSDMKSRNASIQFSTGPPGMPMNIKFSVITNTSFVVQWDKMDGADYYIVNLRDDGGSVREYTPSQTFITITQLSPNTTYNVTLTTIICGRLGTTSDTFTLTTNIIWNAIQLTSISTIMLQQSTSSVMEQSITSSTHFPTESTKMKSDSSSLSTGVAVAVTFTITFIITLTVSVVITFLITFVIVKRKFEKIYKTTHQPTQQMPLYETVITPAITKSDVKLEANPAYSTSDMVVMDNNPAYQSCK